MGCWYPCWAQAGTGRLWCWAVHCWFGENCQIMATSTGYRKDSRQRGSSKIQKPIPICCTGSGESNPEGNVVWPHCCWDPPEQINQQTKAVLVGLQKALKPNHSSDMAHLPLPSLRPHQLQQRPEMQSYFGWVPPTLQLMWAKIASRWGTLEVIEGLMLSSLYTGTPEINKGNQSQTCPQRIHSKIPRGCLTPQKSLSLIYICVFPIHAYLWYSLIYKSGTGKD